MPQNYITLSRSRLYELVWSKPVTELAKDFGISDVALAKRCRAINIPLPPRGYWARVAAGQKPRRPPLPRLVTDRARGRPTKSPAHGYITDRDAAGNPSVEPAVQFASKPARKGQSDDRSVSLGIHIPAITPAADLQAVLPAVKRTARHYRHPLRKELQFPRGEATGPIIEFDVTDGVLERALKFADSFLRAAASLEWALIDPPQKDQPAGPARHHGYGHSAKANKPPPRFADLLVNGERVCFRIEERKHQVRRQATQQEQDRMKREYGFRPVLVTESPTGVLRVVRLSGRGLFDHRKSWYDRSSAPLEAQLPAILAGFRELAQEIKTEREERERKHRAWEEQERLRKEQEARRAANQRLVQELERQAGAWHRAQFLKRYLSAARSAIGARAFAVTLMGEKIDFLAWAEHYVEQLDPLSFAVHDPDLSPEQSNYSDADSDRLRGELRRLSGHAWDRSLKPVAADEVVGRTEPGLT